MVNADIKYVQSNKAKRRQYVPVISGLNYRIPITAIMEK